MPIRLLVIVHAIALAAYLVQRARRRRRGQSEPGTQENRIRRGGGHAILAMQGFIAPGVEHVLETENREHREIEDDRGEGGADTLDRIRADLADALARTPLDADEIRSHLSAASRAGLDWRAIYADAVRTELAARPYRAPAVLPPARVAPRMRDDS